MQELTHAAGTQVPIHTHAHIFDTLLGLTYHYFIKTTFSLHIDGKFRIR